MRVESEKTKFSLSDKGEWDDKMADRMQKPQAVNTIVERQGILMRQLAGDKVNYFATRNRVEEWTVGGQTAELSFFDRPLHAMTDAFAAAGFRISVMSEPPTAPAAHDLFAEELSKFPDKRFLGFLFFVLQAG